MNRRHILEVRHGVLKKIYEKIIQYDERLFMLSQRPFLIEEPRPLYPNISGVLALPSIVDAPKQETVLFCCPNIILHSWSIPSHISGINFQPCNNKDANMVAQNMVYTRSNEIEALTRTVPKDINHIITNLPVLPPPLKVGSSLDSSLLSHRFSNEYPWLMNFTS